jgi:hypothetical protein
MIRMKDRKFPKRVKPDVWEMRTKTLEVITDCKPKQLKGKSDLHNLHSSPVLWNYEIKGDEMGGLFRRDYIVVMFIQNFSRKSRDKTTLLTYYFI